ncbi:MAG: hypothetical protein DU481_15195 [Nitrosomonas sp.]|uniref:major capsid protein n=1 Tax=Nitrosomonas sp. TaxID=42353 RepID=UPI0032EE6F17
MFTKIQAYAVFLLALMLSFIVQQALAAARYFREVCLSFKAKLALLFAPLAVIPSIASAAVPASVTTAITDAVADVGTVGGLVIGVVVIVFAFAMMRKPMNA